MSPVNDKLKALGRVMREKISFLRNKLAGDGQPTYRSDDESQRFRYVVVVLGILLALLLRAALVAIFAKCEKPLPPVQLTLPAHPASIPDLRSVVRGRLNPDLDWAERQSEKSVDDHLRKLDDFFASAQKRTPRFAKDALGLTSEWYLVVDRMPYTRSNRQAQFLRTSFNDDIFSPPQLTKALNQLVKDYVDSEAGIENQMLVKMRADISDLPPSVLASFGNQGELQIAFGRALAQATERAGANLKADVSREVTSAVVAQVLIWATERMGIEAGILTVGASNSWETLGMSMVVALAVDQVVKWVWDWYRNPVGELTGKMNTKLDEMHRLIVEGDNKESGLRAKLKELSTKRAELRRAVIEKLEGQLENKPCH
jgi:hypothetical protein